MSRAIERIRAALAAAPVSSSSVTYVPQRLSRDCGIAALAMASGLSYDEVAQRLPASAVRECTEGEGLFSVQIPQLLGLLGCAVRSVFSESWKSDGLRGIRIYVSRSHYIVMRPDGKVNDPARGEGLDASAYDEPFDGWEVHRLSSRPDAAVASASVVDIAPSPNLPKLIQPPESPGWRGDATVTAFRERLELRIRETVDQVARVAGHASGAQVTLKRFDRFLDCLCDAVAGAALAAAPRDAGREEDSELIDWLATQSAAVMASEDGRTKVFTHPVTTSQGESSIEVHGDGFTEPVYAATLRDALRAARRGERE